MKCYTIFEDMKRGVIVTDRGNNDPRLLIGECVTTGIPIGSDHHDAFEKRAEHIERVRALLQRTQNEALREAADRELRHIYDADTQAVSGLHHRVQRVNGLQNQQPHLRYAEIWAAERPDVMHISAASLSDRNGSHPVQIVRERQHSSECLVHVATQALPGGTLWYESSAWDEVLVQNAQYGDRVDRVYKSFPPPGVDVIATGEGPNGETHVLVRMKSRSSFRICRSGDFNAIAKDGPPCYPVLVVVWPGSSLRVFPPKKYLNEDEEQKAA